ncbi:MAG: hypothetical protein GY829_07290 [Gammaproteobacteria bacterium]|nr:hypothetical protein [Gammaproteobacteria bacterium]
MSKNKLALAVLLSGLLTPTVFATNGYFSHGYGGHEKGMAGAGVAKGSSSISSANNPAGLLDIGDSMDIGVSIFDPVRSYTVEGGPAFPVGAPVIGNSMLDCGDGMSLLPAATCQVPFSHTPDTVDSGREWFMIPSFGYSSRVDEQMVWGVSLYGNGGMNTTYSARDASARLFNPDTNSIVDAPGTYGAGKAGVDFMQLFVNTSIAYQASETIGLGASLIFAAQSFEAKGLAPFANNSSDSTKLTDNGHDVATGFGIKLGMNIDLSEQLRLGISYQSKIDMSEFDDYAGLFAQSGDFDIPSTYTVGLAFQTSDTSTLLLDYQVINYTDVPAIATGIDPLMTLCLDALNNTLMAGTQMPAAGSGCLGGTQGAGFGWDDMSVIKLGYEWQVGKDTFRVGYSTTEQPISNTQLNFNILAPGVVENHFTAGYTSGSGDNEWTAFIMYAPEVEITGISGFDPSQTITIRMNQLEFGFDYKF